jgi:catalase
MAKSTKPTLKKSNVVDLALHRGPGGELHQTAEDGFPVLTTAQGGPVSDDHNSLKVNGRGPTLLEDFHFREKIFHFDHERIPERVVHARGYGAHGFFENYEPLSEFTRADLFQEAGTKTPAFVRFSTVAGSKGSFDLARDVRGFAVKLYTKEGNWDLVGNNIPVFFIQDAIRFPDLVHAVKEEPDSAFPQAQSAHDNFWDFISLTPESMHMIMWVMSDRAIPRSFRFMEGFGVHTFRFVNAKDQSTFVKFHWKPKLGLQSVVWNEAVKINGADPDFHRRDLWDAIKSGNFPEWELCVQLFDEKFADEFEFDVLDPTKLIPEEVLPVKPIGRLVLNRMPDNFFAETEQVAFMTQNVPPGIDFSNDPLLQGRNFSYLDTQLKRLGSPNFVNLPINAPKCPFHHFQQDGHMAVRNPSGRANYQPNSWEQGPRESPLKGFSSFAEPLEGMKQRSRSASFSDHYSQARMFFQSQTEPEQYHIGAALTFELSKVKTAKIRERMVSHLLNIHKDLAAMVIDGLGMKKVPAAADSAVEVRTDLPSSAALSIIKNGPNRFEGRKLGLLLSNGADAKLVKSLQKAISEQGGVCEVIAPEIGGVTLTNDAVVPGNQMLKGAPSVLYDAVALVFGPMSGKEMADKPEARDFVADAYSHCKFIAFSPEALPLLEKAGIASSIDQAMIQLENEKSVSVFKSLLGKLRHWDRERLFDTPTTTEWQRSDAAE